MDVLALDARDRARFLLARSDRISGHGARLLRPDPPTTEHRCRDGATRGTPNS